jgi:WD40 repeat protein/serine/threonine protein kinase
VPGYEILGELGRGGMGVVYKARQVKLNRPVALKMILAGSYAAPAQRDRFLAEARAVARLHHPNIVQIYEIGEHDGRPYFSLEFVEGGSLDRKLAGTPQPPREAANLVAILARAMQAAHETGIVHRDLKPANVLMTAQGTPKITDFGLAKDLEEQSGQTQTGAIMGTPSYMAPEQASGRVREIGPHSDVYALGVILYEMLTGRPPFKGTSVLDTLGLVRSVEAVPPSRLQPKIPRDLEIICLKCLEKEPRKRYGGASHLAEELDRFLRGEPIQARPVGSAERLWRWCRRHPLEAALVAAVILSLLGGLAASLYLMDQAHTDAAIARQNEKRAQDESERADRNARESKANAARATQNEQTAAREAHNARRSESAARRSQYISDMNLAQQALESGDVVRALELLKTHVPEPGQEDFRGFEWHYLWKLGHNDLASLPWPDGDVRAVAVSRDGALLAAGGGSPGAGEVRLWDLAGRKELRTLKGHRSIVTAVAFAPGGRLLASAGGAVNQPGEVKLWDLATGQPLATLAGKLDPVTSLAFSPDGATLLTGTAKLIPGAGSPSDRYFHVDFTRVSTRQGGVLLWDIASRKVRTTLPGVTGDVLSVAWSPDGKTVAAGTAEGKVLLWHTASGQAAVILRAQIGYVWSLAFAPDGKTLAAACGRWNEPGELKLWDMDTKQERRTLRGHKGGVTALTYAPDGKTLASGGWDRLIKLWDERGTELATVYGSTGYVWGLGFAPDNRTLVSCNWNWTPLGGRAIKLWDIRRQRTFAPLPRNAGFQVGEYIRTAFDARSVAMVEGSARAVGVWDAATGQKRATIPFHGGRTVALSPDGLWLAVGGFWAETHLCDAATGQVMAKLATASVPRLSFSPDSKTLATAGDDGVVRLWEVPTGRERVSLRSHTDVVWCLSFNSGGTRLATASWDQTVKIWDLTTYQLLATLKGHQDAIWEVWFINDDRALVTVSHGGAIGLWDALGPEAPTEPTPPDVEKKPSSLLIQDIKMNMLAAAAYRQRGQPDEAERIFRRIRNGVGVLVRGCPNVPAYRFQLGSWIESSVIAFFKAFGHPEDAAWAYQQSSELVDHAQWAREAEELLAANSSDPVALYNSACCLARGAARALKDIKLAEAKRQSMARTYADRAMERLRMAIAKGFNNLPLAQTDPDLDFLRTRDDFKKLLAEWEARSRSN